MIVRRIAKATLIAATFLAANAWGGAVLTLPSGNVQVGVNDQGHLIVSGIGITRVGLGDGISPGCFCEGWGVSASGTPGWASIANGSIVNIGLTSFNSPDSSNATSVTTLTGTDLSITHAYSPSVSPDLFLVAVTLTNTGAGTLNDVRYARSMDWDIPPTTFSEVVSLGGWPASALFYSGDDGFCTPNPLNTAACAEIVPGTISQNFTKKGPEDHGAVFVFTFGSLLPGASTTFSIYYGVAANEAGSFTALGAVGAEVYSLGYSNDGAGGANTDSPVWIFGFSGVGGTPVSDIPEPSTWALMGLGMGAILIRRIKR